MPDIKKYLNRDGLDEYNSLLPHSRGEMQTYVNDWLDEHPEATTTVQDDAITEPKLADKSVSLRTLADDTIHMLKGAILTGNLSGEVLTADDAYSAPPVALAIEGKSTQDGTPTPDAPVEIVSVEQVNLHLDGRNLLDYNYLYDTTPSYTNNYFYFYNIKLPAGTYTLSCNWCDVPSQAPYGFLINGSSTPETTWRCYKGHPSTITVQEGQTAVIVRRHRSGDYVPTRALHDNGTIELQLSVSNTALPYQPYDGTSVLLPLTQALRSLPDGTHDTLALSYLKPSTREGWAWYLPTQTRVVAFAKMAGMNWSRRTSGSTGTYVHAVFQASVGNYNWTTHGVMCSALQLVTPASEENFANDAQNGTFTRVTNRQNLVTVCMYEIDTVEAFVAWLESVDAEFIRIRQTPEILTLDPIELPILPAPDVTVWSDPSTGLQMEYVRDANIVIQNIEQAIADL